MAWRLIFTLTPVQPLKINPRVFCAGLNTCERTFFAHVYVNLPSPPPAEAVELG